MKKLLLIFFAFIRLSLLFSIEDFKIPKQNIIILPVIFNQADMENEKYSLRIRDSLKKEMVDKHIFKIISFAVLDSLLKKENIFNKQLTEEQILYFGNKFHSNYVISTEIIILNNETISIQINAFDIIKKQEIISFKKDIKIELDFLYKIDEISSLVSNDIKKSTIENLNINNKLPVNQIENKSDDLVKRRIMLLSLSNLSTNTEYNYLSNVIRNALKSEVEKSEIYHFVDFKLVDSEVDQIKNEDDGILKINKLLNTAIKINSDVIIYGNFNLVENNIIIKINVIDILTGETVIKIEKKSVLGIDLLNIVDESAKEISDNMSVKIKKVRESYYYNKIKEQEKKITLELSKEKKKEKIIQIDNLQKRNDIKGNILAFYNFNIHNEVEIDDPTIEKILKIYIESLSNEDNINIFIQKYNDKNISKKILLKKGVNSKSDYVFFCDIKYIYNLDYSKLKKIENEIIIKTIILDVTKNKEIHLSNIYDDEIKEKLISLIKESRIAVDNFTFFNRGIEQQFGIGFYPINFKGFYSNTLNLESKKISDRIMMLPFFQWGVFPDISLSYYSNPFHSIGFNIKTGYAPSILLYWVGGDEAFSIYTHSLLFNLSMKHKIGSIKNKIKFLLEYGGEFNLIFPLSKADLSYPDEDILLIGDFYFNGGPTLLAGLEIDYKKFSYELGFVVGFIYGGNSFQNYQIDTRSYNIGHTTLGIEMRFNLKSFKNYFFDSIKIEL